MLANPPISKEVLNKEVELKFTEDMKLKNPSTGVFESPSFNIASTYFDDGSVYHVNEKKIIPLLTELHIGIRNNTITLDQGQELENKYYGWYGVSDNLEQVLEKFKDQVEDEENKFVITMTPVHKNNEKGGWRWHKWGEYIGTQNPEFEYLNDEEHIDLVYCYHVYQFIK